MSYQTITRNEFNVLDLEERALIIGIEGSFVSVDPDGPSNFYAVADYYVEVQVSMDAQRVEKITAFRKGPRYERMVACIELAQL
jgi:hypothetical protein